MRTRLYLIERRDEVRRSRRRRKRASARTTFLAATLRDQRMLYFRFSVRVEEQVSLIPVAMLHSCSTRVSFFLEEREKRGKEKKRNWVDWWYFRFAGTLRLYVAPFVAPQSIGIFIIDSQSRMSERGEMLLKNLFISRRDKLCTRARTFLCPP